MELSLDIIGLIQKSVTVHIYSYPYFALESFLAFAVCIIFIFLHMEISRLFDEFKQRKAKHVKNKVVKRQPSRESPFLRSITHFKRKIRTTSSTPSKNSLEKIKSSSDQEMDLILEDFAANDTNIEDYNSVLRDRNALLNLSPQQYVELDMLRKKVSKRQEKSLTSLAQDMLNQKISQNAILNQIDNAKENAYCYHSKIAHKVSGLQESNKYSRFQNNETVSQVKHQPTFTYSNDVLCAYELGNLSHEELYKQLIDRRFANKSSNAFFLTE